MPTFNPGRLFTLRPGRFNLFSPGPGPTTTVPAPASTDSRTGRIDEPVKAGPPPRFLLALLRALSAWGV